MINASPSDSADELARIRDALERLLTDPAFVRAPQMSAFLKYVVDQTLNGDAERIKAYTIGIDALGKPTDFDPQTDPSVRVLAKRLRDRLQEHYAHHVDARLRIELISGSYRPRFVEMHDSRSPPSPPSPASTDRPDPTGRAGTRIETRSTPCRADERGPYTAFPSSVRAINASNRDRHDSLPSPASSDRSVLYLITCQSDDRLAQHIAILLSGMLSRDQGVDARRVDRAPAIASPSDRSLTLHVTRLDEELRVDLQVCRSTNAEIVRADVLLLHPDPDDTLAREDFERLERWVGGYAAQRRGTRPTAPREPLAGWLAGGRERGGRGTQANDPGTDDPDAAAERVVGL